MCSAVHFPVGVLVRNLAKLAKSDYEGSEFTAPFEMLVLKPKVYVKLNKQTGN